MCFILLLVSFIVYLLLDYQSYYYGFGKGFLSKKIPESFSVSLLFAGSDLGYQGMILEEKIDRLLLVSKDDPIHLDDDKEITVKKFLGYFFNEKMFIVRVLGDDNAITDVEVIPKKSEKDSSYIYHNFKGITTLNEKELKYINLDKSISYFQYFKLLKNVSLLVLLFMCVINVVNIIKSKKC